MAHAAISDCRQVDLIEPVPLGKSGEIGSQSGTVNRICAIARLSAVDGPGVGSSEPSAYSMRSVQRLRPYSFSAPLPGISREPAGSRRAASLNQPVNPVAASSP